MPQETIENPLYALTLDLINDIYKGIVDPKSWDLIIRRLILETGAIKGMISLRSPESTDMMPSEVPILAPKIVNIEPKYIGSYLDHYYEIDPWTKFEATMEYTSVIQFSELLPRRELVRSVFYREYLFPQKIEDGYAVTLVQGENKKVILNLLIDSSPSMPPAQIKTFLSTLAPHLQRAFSTAVEFSRLKYKNNVLSTLLDNRREGLILLKANLEIVYLNNQAKNIIDANKVISSQGYIFSLKDRKAQDKLSQIIQSMVKEEGHRKCYMAVSREGGKPPLQLNITPFTHTLDTANYLHASLILFISDPVKYNPLNVDVLVDLYSLTSTEVRLVKSLIGGTSLSEYASTQGVSINTARWHLSNIFNKVEVNSQQELILKALSFSESS